VRNIDLENNDHITSEQLLEEAFHYKQNRQLSKVEEIAILLEQESELFKMDFNLAYGLGMLYKWLDVPRKAKMYFQRAVMLKPEESIAWRELGNIEIQMKDIEAAITHYMKAISITPEDAFLRSDLGCLLSRLGKYKEALECFDKALMIEPENTYAHCNRYHTLLKLGDYTKGFAEMEYRLKIPFYRNLIKFTHHLPRWKGENFIGKRLLVHHEQGFGDAMMLIRYLPLIKARGGYVILSTKKPLFRLFSKLAGVDELIEHTPVNILESKADVTVSLMSLPFVFNTTLCNIPREIPYLSVDSSILHSWNEQINPNIFNVGIVWVADPTHCSESVDTRTCGIKTFSYLTKIKGIQLYSLQKGNAGKEAKDLLSDMNIIDYTDQFADFLDTASFIANLDLVISVDTAVAHLAGALGKPVWVLLPYDHSWRWIANRLDSPWYPTARVFRQPRCDDWTSITSEVAKLITSSLRK